jgi:hypothetical protein
MKVTNRSRFLGVEIHLVHEVPRLLNLVAVKRTTVQVFRPLLQCRLQMMEHDLLY